MGDKSFIGGHRNEWITDASKMLDPYELHIHHNTPSEADRDTFRHKKKQEKAQQQHAQHIYSQTRQKTALQHLVPYARRLWKKKDKHDDDAWLESQLEDFIYKGGLDDDSQVSELLHHMQRNGGDKHALRQAKSLLASLQEEESPLMSHWAIRNMLHASPNNKEGIEEIEKFIKNPALKNIGESAAGYTTLILANSEGNPEVAQTLSDLLQDPTFLSYGAKMRANLLANIALLTEVPQILTGLQNIKAQVMKGMIERNVLNYQVTQKTASKLKKLQSELGERAGPTEGGSRRRRVTAQVLPPVPPIDPLDELLSEEEAEKRTQKNLAVFLQYCQKTNMLYKNLEHYLKNDAKYFEDIAAIPLLHQDPVAEYLKTCDKGFKLKTTSPRVQKLLDTSQKAIEEKSKHLRERYSELCRKQNSLMFVLRNEHVPVTENKDNEASLQPGQSNTDDIVAQNILAKKQTEPSHTDTVLNQIKQDIEMLFYHLGIQTWRQWRPLGPTTPQLLGKQKIQLSKTPSTPITTGKKDSYAIQRTFEKDLGAMRNHQASDKKQKSTYTPGNPIRPKLEASPHTVAVGKTWRDLNRAERALYQNMGWDQSLWDNETPQNRLEQIESLSGKKDLN